MPTRAKRFYLCNLIPLGEIDERDMAVDWPVYAAVFGDLVEMRADVSNRPLNWSTDAGATANPALKVRFEVYESDFLLSGGLNDRMGVYSSHADFGDSPTVRPVRVVPDVDRVPEAERESAIFVQWVPAHDRPRPSGGGTDHVPDTLRIRCWWRVAEDDDVSGDPEFYYDVYVDAPLTPEGRAELHERSDHELVGMRWNVTDTPRDGRVTPLVDGEYAYLKMLQLMDGAQNSIHVCNWKMDPQATLVVEHEFQGDYLQVPGLDPAAFRALLTRCKPLTGGISAAGGFVAYGASNGNVMVASGDGTSIVTAVRHKDDPTNLDLPGGMQILSLSPPIILMLDRLRSRLLLFMAVDRGVLRELDDESDRGYYALAIPAPPSGVRAYRAFQVRPTFPAVDGSATHVSVLIPLAGDGNPGYADGGTLPYSNEVPVRMPTGKMNRPHAVITAGTDVYISDTGNHCIRRIRGFGPTLDAALLTDLRLETLAGTNAAGDVDAPTARDARFNGPTGLAWDESRTRLLVADTGNRKIKAVRPSSDTVLTVAVASIDGAAGAALGEVVGLAIDPAAGPRGTLFAVERDRHRVLRIDLDTLAATTLAGVSGTAGYRDGAAAQALFRTPTDAAFDGGTLYVTDSANHVVRAIDVAAGTVRTIGSTTDPGVQDVPVVLADVLRRKAAEGVAVRVLLDGYASAISRDDFGGMAPGVGIGGAQVVADLKHFHAGIDARVQDHPQTLGGQQFASFHDKMMVVDGRAAVTGGLDFAPDKNDGLAHERRHRNSLRWHDVVALVEGPLALSFEEHFVRRWGMLPSPRPEITAVNRADASIQDHRGESVRTYDRFPVFMDLFGGEVQEVLASYRRIIRTARRYVYLEHQYIYYPEVGEALAEAMRENPALQVIWMIPFFTEESADPHQERAALVARHGFADSLTDAAEFRAGGGTGLQLRSQFTWHGFYHQRRMVEMLRGVDPARFGVFSMQRLTPRGRAAGSWEVQQIYPHSKMILADDRIFSIGSANANGRGFTKDGENNVTALAPAAGRELRNRLWGEHLGFSGVARVGTGGTLLPLGGHHLAPGGRVRLRHPVLGDVEREVGAVDAVSGGVTLTGAPLDGGLGRLLWHDLALDALDTSTAVDFWRRHAHSLQTFRQVKGLHATVNAAGKLVVPGNLAQAGDRIHFGARMLLVDEDGRASTDPVSRPYAAGQMEVLAVAGDEIEVSPTNLEAPNVDWVAAMTVGQTVPKPPFRATLVSRTGGRAQLRLTLAPNQQDVPYDYLVSWLMRQPGPRRAVRAWEIDPPEGIRYAGPGSLLFSPWFVLPWLLVDFNPDEQARLEVPTDGTAVA